MLMNRWRIGSLSMGIILVALGVLMLVSLITQVNVFLTITTLWPIIMICLGIEILLYLFLGKGGGTDGKIKYDVLSIFFISFILIISTAFYGITLFTGALDSRENMYTAFGIYHEIAYDESSIELTGADELMVFNGLNSMKILSTTDRNIRVDYRVTVNSTDKAYAESIIAGAVQFENGKRAYLLPNTDMFYNNRRISAPIISCVIYLPQDKILDLSQFYGHYEYDSVVEKQIVRS